MLKHVFLIVLMLVTVGCTKAPPMSEQLSAYYGPYPSNYEQIIKDKMVTVLFDPYSAQYHFEGTPSSGYYARPFGAKAEYGWYGTVYINAKNRMGGYVGATKYSYLIRDGKLIVFEENFQR